MVDSPPPAGSRLSNTPEQPHLTRFFPHSAVSEKMVSSLIWPFIEAVIVHQFSHLMEKLCFVIN
jgi:hypothetical protein